MQSHPACIETCLTKSSYGASVEDLLGSEHMHLKFPRHKTDPGCTPGPPKHTHTRGIRVFPTLSIRTLSSGSRIYSPKSFSSSPCRKSESSGTSVFRSMSISADTVLASAPKLMSRVMCLAPETDKGVPNNIRMFHGGDRGKECYDASVSCCCGCDWCAVCRGTSSAIWLARVEHMNQVSRAKQSRRLSYFSAEAFIGHG